MIEKLHSHPVYTDDGCGITGLIRPSTSEIIDKLNEIIDVVNNLEATSDNDREENRRCLRIHDNNSKFYKFPKRS